LGRCLAITDLNGWKNMKMFFFWDIQKAMVSFSATLRFFIFLEAGMLF
jgi:hypothetical protein